MIDPLSWHLLDATAHEWERADTIVRHVHRYYGQVEPRLVVNAAARLLDEGLLEEMIQGGRPDVEAVLREPGSFWFFVTDSGRALRDAELPGYISRSLIDRPKPVDGTASARETGAELGFRLSGTFTEDAGRLIADVLGKHRRSIVAFAPVVAADRSEQILDEFAARAGLLAIGNGWRLCSKDEAPSLAAKFLARDLAFGSQIMTDGEAGELGKRFAGMFAPDATFFINTGGMFGFSTWASLTTCTFDVGVLGVDARTIGVLVVYADD